MENETGLTREQILVNRRIWVNFLKNKHLKKAQEVLDAGNGSRCCLGHGCYILKIKRTKTNTNYFVYGETKEHGLPPNEFVSAVGLWHSDGTGYYKENSLKVPSHPRIESLVDLNDETPMRPWQIGEYLETVIEGGADTPFKPLSNYPE